MSQNSKSKKRAKRAKTTSEEMPEPQALVALNDQPPVVLPTVVLDDVVPFPGALVPVLLESRSRRDAILHARANSEFVFLVNRQESAPDGAPPDDDHAQAIIDELRRSDDDEGGDGTQFSVLDAGRSDGLVDSLDELSHVGVVARLVRVFTLPDDRMSGLLHLVRRSEPIELIKSDPFPIVRVEHVAETAPSGKRLQAMFRQVRLKLQAFFEAHPSVSDEARQAALSIDSPAGLADFVAQHLSRDFEERREFLLELDVGRRLHRALEVAVREVDLLTVGNRISDDIKEKVEKHQRDFFLREQMKAIRVELGEEKDPATLAIEELEAKLREAGLPEQAQEKADSELKRLQMVPPESPEHNIVRTYLDWLANLPWAKLSDESLDIVKAREVLDEDHYGLEEVKDRIIEFLAVQKLNPERRGTLLCFAGPPGVGKTSLGRSIARALGREFYRFSVGGMRDEAEIKGHRRTYVGAMPGRVLQGLRLSGTANPVFMLDELDKVGSDWRGDPSSALLEVLDPAQNNTFMDHYLDLPFDLSRVMFIATVNVKAELPDALRDRLEVIDLPGYIPEEKLEIAKRYLVPRQRRDHGLAVKQFQVGPPTLKRVVREYTHEAGVRELDRMVAKLARKRATEVVSKVRFVPRVSPEHLETYLGPSKVHEDPLVVRPRPGVAVGLAWTATGGDVLLIESVLMPGKGQLKITGQLGDVMTESATLALSYVRYRAESLDIDPSLFKDRDIHLHFPAGAVKKDGPSAGITVTTALIGLLTGRRVKPRLAMTGEITLRGDVLPVGGIREKVVAARRAGVKTIVTPEQNRADVEQIPEMVRKGLTVVLAENYDDVYTAAFEPASTKRKRATAAPEQPQRRAAKGR